MCLRPDAPLGRLLRLPLRLMPPNAVVPILSGPNRGLRWRVDAGIHGCWLGSYERFKLGQFVDAIAPNAVVYDIGAHAGYYTLAAARRARQVLAFEPNPANQEALRFHLARNRLDNVVVYPAAVGAAPGTAQFSSAGDGYRGRLGAGELTVKVEALDALIEAGAPAPDLVKMDVEGAELAALDGAAALLATRHALWFIALHGPECARGTIARLLDNGYRVRSLEGEALTRPRDDIEEIVAVPG